VTVTETDFDRDFRWPLLRLLNRRRKPACTPSPDQVRKLKGNTDRLAEDLTTERDAAIRDFLARVRHHYYPGWDGSFTPPCLCGNPLGAPLHHPSGTLLHTMAWVGKVDAGEIDWRSLPGDMAGLDPRLLDTEPPEHTAPAAVPEGAGGEDTPLPRGVIGYLIGFTDLEHGPVPTGTTHTTLMSLGEACREIRAHGVSTRFRWFPVEVREVPLTEEDNPNG
jgi:hypothetical protein